MAEARPGEVVGSKARRRYKNLGVGCQVSGSFKNTITPTLTQISAIVLGQDCMAILFVHLIEIDIK
jgi:hypothetical protein